MRKREYFWGWFIKDEDWISEYISKTMSSEKSLLRNFKIYRINKKYSCSIESEIKFKKGVFFAHKASGVTIGSSVSFEGRAMIHQNTTIGMGHTKGDGMPTIFKGDIMIGSGCFISADKGITIGENVIIGANSVVTKSIPANSVVTGVNNFKEKNVKEMTMVLSKIFENHTFPNKGR